MATAKGISTGSANQILVGRGVNGSSFWQDATNKAQIGLNPNLSGNQTGTLILSSATVAANSGSTSSTFAAGNDSRFGPRSAIGLGWDAGIPQTFDSSSWTNMLWAEDPEWTRGTGITYDDASGSFTVSQSGLYLASLGVITTLDISARIIAAFVKNGDEGIGSIFDLKLDAAYFRCTQTAILNLAANDSVLVQFWNDNAGGLTETYFTSSEGGTHFQIYHLQ